MKPTGIIRRIDDLGRIVVPKEIRRNLKIKEGDPFEIFISEDMVCFKPYRITQQLSYDIEQILNENAAHLNDKQIKIFNDLVKALKD